MAAQGSAYDMQRNRIKQDTLAANQEQNSALQRRFARIGSLNSGAYVKASERLAGQQEQNQQRALEGVDVQESLAAEQKAEAERGRSFSREERLGSQQFAAGESALGRKLQSEQFGMSLAEQQAARKQQGEQFTSAQAQQKEQFGQGLQEQQAARSQQAQQFKDAQSQDWTKYQDQRDTQVTLNREAAAQQNEQFRQQMGMANKQFVLDETVSNFNMEMANKIFNQKDMFEKAVDPFGGIDNSYTKGHAAFKNAGNFDSGGGAGGFFAGGPIGAFAGGYA